MGFFYQKGGVVEQNFFLLFSLSDVPPGYFPIYSGLYIYSLLSNFSVSLSYGFGCPCVVWVGHVFIKAVLFS